MNPADLLARIRAMSPADLRAQIEPVLGQVWARRTELQRFAPQADPRVRVAGALVAGLILGRVVKRIGA